MNILKTLSNGAARKALAGYVVPAVVVIGGALLPGSDGGSTITAQEWISAAVAALSCGTVVYAIPNRPGKASTDA